MTTGQNYTSLKERAPKGVNNLTQLFAISPEPLRFLRNPPSYPPLPEKCGAVAPARMQDLFLKLDESVSLFSSREFDG